MTSEAAAVKLMWCLGKRMTLDQISEAFKRSYVGEVAFRPTGKQTKLLRVLGHAREDIENMDRQEVKAIVGKRVASCCKTKFMIDK